MVYRKNKILRKSLIVIFAILFFSCDKTSEKTKEDLAVLDQKILSESADISVEEPEPIPPPKESEEKTLPVPESVVPEQIRRPQYGEALRFPEDSIVGILGKGEAPADSYHFVQETLKILLQEKSEQTAPEDQNVGNTAGQTVLSNLPPEESERIISILQELNPEKIRIGGGREEIDGSVSFLLRFMGSGSWSGGEIYVKQNEDVWSVEDLFLDEPREGYDSKNQYRFDFSPYERFF